MSFLQPFFLLGVGLTAVPIIIHLWFHKRLQKIPFSSLKFLKKTEAKKLGWLRFREILILILRCLLIIFIFLSLAKPQVRRPVPGARRLASVILLLDNSYSMDYGENFTLAKEAAAEILSLYSAGSEFIVLPLCDKTDFHDTDAPISWVDKRSALQIIEEITLSNKTGRLSALLTGLTPSEKAKHHLEYIYIGDGQEVTFRGFSEDITADTVDFYWLKIPCGGNVSIESVAVKDPISIPEENYSLYVKLMNYSSRFWQGKVVLQAGGYHYEREAEIQAQSDLKVEFLLPVSVTHGKFTVYDDSLLKDNSYFFSKSLPERIKVLIVGDDKFLRTALQPADKLNPLFVVKTASTLKGVDLRRFTVVILNGVPDISKSDIYRLHNFIAQRRHGFIFFPGAEIGENLKTFLSQYCTPGETVAAQGYVTIDWIDYNHPIFKVFDKNVGLKNIKIYRFHKFSTDKKVIAKFTGEYPFIIVDGNVAVLALRFEPQTTNIVYKAAFVPLLFRLIINVCNASPDKEFYVGDTVPETTGLKAPTGEYLKTGDKFLLPGFYTTPFQTLGVNVVPEEGNLKVLGKNTAEVLNIHILDMEKDLKTRSLSRLFLFLALFCLIAELLLLLA